MMAAEVVICRQRRRARAGEGFHASRENLLLALIEFAELRLAIAGSHRVEGWGRYLLGFHW
jgi:hypothetical protein